MVDPLDYTASPEHEGSNKFGDHNDKSGQSVELNNPNPTDEPSVKFGPALINPRTSVTPVDANLVTTTP